MKEVSKHPLKHLRQHEKGQWRNSPKSNVAMFPFSEEYTMYSCLDSGTQNTNVNVELDYHYNIATCVM